jgi:uroporphyrinogen decarboxylase
MLRREIIKSVLDFKPIKPIPFWIHNLYRQQEGIAIELDAYYGSTEWRKTLDEYMEMNFFGKSEPKPDGTIIDTFGVQIEMGNIEHVLDWPLKTPSLNGYKWPEPDDLVDWDKAIKVFSLCGDKYRIGGLDAGLFERCWMLRGFENFMMDVIENTNFVEDMLEHIFDIHLRTMDLIKARIPLDGYYYGDDIADQRGIMMGQERWRNLIKLRLAQLIDYAHELGYKVIYHCCGNIIPVIEDFIEIGVDCHESMQPEATNLLELERKAKGKICFVGGLGNQSTLHCGTPYDVREKTRWLLEHMSERGGYIVGPSKPFLAESVENAVAFLETVINQNV